MAKKMLTFSKKIFCTLADDLVANLSPPSLRFRSPSVLQYYEKILKLTNSKFQFNFASKEAVLKLLNDLDENKAAGLDNLSGKVLKDGATVLAKLISQFCNLSKNIQYFCLTIK